MSFEDELARFTDTNSAPQAARLPANFQPSVTYDAQGRAEVTTLGVGEPGDDWGADVAAMGVTIPDGWTVRLVEVRHDPAAWVRHAHGDDATTEAVTRRRYVVEPARTVANIDELVAAVGKRRPAPQPVGDGWAYVHAIADWQIGKTAYGEGTDQTVGRILDALDQSVKRLKRERKYRPTDTVVLAGLGDLCEGVISQKGAVALSSDLGLTEQLRVVRRLLLEHVKVFADLADRVVLVSAPGNHDEPHRLMGGRARADDSFAVDAAVQVGDALALAGGFEHVEIVLPDVDDLTVTIEAGNTIIGFAHGHQTRPGKAHEWWAKMGHARHRIGDAQLLMTGHYHHLRVHEESGRTHIQAPSVDPGSPWFDHKNGGVAGPGGVVTLFVRDGAWTSLEAL